jgi:hypothetical protein
VSEEESKSLTYVQTHGVDDPSKSATSFFLAAAMDIESAIYFTMDGAALLKKGVAEGLMIKRGQGDRVTGSSWTRLRNWGVKFHVPPGQSPPRMELAPALLVPPGRVIVAPNVWLLAGSVAE